MNEILNKKYFILIFMCFFAYMISYIGRLGYNVNIQNFIDTYNITRLEAGYASSAFFFCYGAGQFLNGMFCDKMNSIKVVSFSLMISGILSFCLFFIYNVVLVSTIWGLNGLSLSTLWCNVIKLTSKIKNEKYKQKSVVWLSVSLPVGTLFAYGVSSLFTYINIWQVYFLISALILMVGGFLFFMITSKTDKIIVEYEREIDVEIEKPAEIKKSLIKFLSFAIIPIFLLLASGTFVKDGVQTWMPTFLTDNYDMPTYFSILVTLILPVFGFFSAVVAKALMNKIKDVFISTFLVLLAVIILLIIHIIFSSYTPIIPIIVFALLNFFIHIQNANLTAIFPVYYSDYVSSGMVAGIFNCFAYVGSTLSSALIGGFVDGFGWNAFNFIILGCAGLCAILSIITFFLMKNKVKIK